MINLDMKDVKPSVLSWFVVGMLSVTFIVFAKFVTNQYDNPVTRLLRPLINAV